MQKNGRGVDPSVPATPLLRSASDRCREGDRARPPLVRRCPRRERMTRAEPGRRDARDGGAHRSRARVRPLRLLRDACSGRHGRHRRRRRAHRWRRERRLVRIGEDLVRRCLRRSRERPAALRRVRHGVPDGPIVHDGSVRADVHGSDPPPLRRCLHRRIHRRHELRRVRYALRHGALHGRDVRRLSGRRRRVRLGLREPEQRSEQLRLLWPSVSAGPALHGWQLCDVPARAVVVRRSLRRRVR